MGKQKLNPKILSKLKEIFPERSEGSIRARLSQLSSKHSFTLGAAAETMARQKKRTVGRLLEDEDRNCLRNNEIKIVEIKENSRKNNQKEIIKFIIYITDNKFLKLHLEEINKCYTAKCYTASFILIRKVIENLITEIIKKKLPNQTKEHKELYLNFSTGHVRDLSELIKNLRDKTNSFDPDEKKIVQRILQLSEQFKDDANDKTHSLYHISSKKELDDKNPQQILDLIKEFFDKY